MVHWIDKEKPDWACKEVEEKHGRAWARFFEDERWEKESVAESNGTCAAKSVGPYFYRKKSESVAGKYGGRAVAAKKWRDSGGGNIWRESCGGKKMAGER
jgi:hypothetical protein